ncbi:MAG: hemerythrin domain-containing protein [Rhodospirillaceae bacterium]|nr:hemerythrin domain-containing protein [Rhodospirillales bacterium]
MDDGITNADTPERWMNSREIDRQHHQIMDALKRLMQEALGNSAEGMAGQFFKICDLLSDHFRDEEAFLTASGSILLSTQQMEHGLLSRMLSNMRGLMESSEQLQWRATVIDEAIDALAIHFAKEEGIFDPLIGRQRVKNCAT